MLVQIAFGSCLARSCGMLTERRALFCADHDQMVPDDTRELLARYYRPGKTPTRLFVITLERARDEIAYAERVGHKMERNTVFDW